MLTTQEQVLLKKEMIEDEGLEHFIYKDSLGNDTVGIGHLCKNGFSDAVIDLIFQEDWQKHFNFLLKSFAWFGNLNFPRKYALISMSFNLGDSGFLKFPGVISAIENKDYQKASEEMLDSLWEKQVPKRAKKLANIIKTGVLE